MKYAATKGKSGVIRTHLQKQDKLHGRVLIGLIIFGLIESIFIHPHVVGHDRRFFIFIFLLPTLVGMVLLAMYRRKFLLNAWQTEKLPVVRVFLVGLYLAEGILFSWLSLGQAAQLTWDYFTVTEASRNATEVVYCPVTQFYSGTVRSGPYVWYTFNGRPECCYLSYASLRKYRDQDPKKFSMVLEVRKSIWNYYQVDNWSIEPSGEHSE